MFRTLVLAGWLITFLVILIALPGPVSAQEITATSSPPAQDGISAPANDAVLSGEVKIIGTAPSGWSLGFSYRDDPTGTWFGIRQSSGLVASGLLASWDTRSLTDGFYVLRLRFDLDGISQEYMVNVRVQNYLAIETATPTATPMASPIWTPTATAISSPTLEAIITETEVTYPLSTMLPALPPNPATLDPQDILLTIGEGILAVLVVFALTGLMLSIRPK